MRESTNGEDKERDNLGDDERGVDTEQGRHADAHEERKDNHHNTRHAEHHLRAHCNEEDVRKASSVEHNGIQRLCQARVNESDRIESAERKFDLNDDPSE